MRGEKIKAFAVRAVLAAVTWYALTDGAPAWDAWIIGAPAVVVSAWLATRLIPSFEWSWRGAARFAVFFLLESWRGGVDVARRAFALRMPLAPGYFSHRLGALPDIARVAVSNVSSLLPGTIVVDVEARRLLVHALDLEHPAAVGIVAETESRVAAMFALDGDETESGAR